MNQAILTAEALWFDGKNARATEVRISILDGELRVGGRLVEWKTEELQPDGFFRIRLGGVDEGVLEGRSLPVASWLRRAKHSGHAVASSETDQKAEKHRSRKKVILVWAGVVVALCSVLYVLALPRLAVFVIGKLPRSWDIELGESALREIPIDTAAPAGPVKNSLASCQAFLNRIPVEKGIAFRLRWINDTSTINAFALPSGDILLYQGLVLKMEKPEELEGVLAHEAGHVVFRHGMLGIVRASLLGVATSLALGHAGGIAAILADEGQNLLQLKFSRNQEAEADRFSLHVLASQKQPCRGLENFFRRGVGMKLPGWTRFISTHPSDNERVKSMEEQRNRELGCSDASTTSISASDLQALKNN